MDWNLKLKQLMGQATHLVRSGQLADATRAIQQALGSASATAPGPAAPQPERAGPAPVQAPAAPFAFRTGTPWRSSAAQDVEDAVVVERGTVQAPPDAARPAPPSGPGARPAAAAPHAAEPPDSFTAVAFSHPGAPHNPHHYHLYVPPGAGAGTPMPLVLMLHGCTQNPVDFATGTGMNAAAAPANALVLYPAQPHSANPNGCWNWFRPEDQRRGGGEPALLVAMVQDVMARHPVDARRVYAAGLSAGGAMAALLGREYPDVFAAVGVHSGLQAGAAHNVMGALSAMKHGARPAAGTPAPGAVAAAPLIVFHGDADTTVHARNGEQLVQTARASAPGTVELGTHQGQSAGGQGYTRTVYGLAGAPVAEHWVLHGGGHAWAGGHAQGSHTDPRGVSATREMLRFFLEHPRGLAGTPP